jgi:hypothetical protein
MTEDSGTRKFKKEDFITGDQEKDAKPETFTKDDIDSLSDLFSKDSSRDLDDTGPIQPLKDTEE